VQILDVRMKKNKSDPDSSRDEHPTSEIKNRKS